MVVREQDGSCIMHLMTSVTASSEGHVADCRAQAGQQHCRPQQAGVEGLAAKPQWRRLIPLSAFAEAEGEKGWKTRTWPYVTDQPIFVWGAFLRVGSEALHRQPLSEANVRGA